MNIKKINPLGLYIAKKGFVGGLDKATSAASDFCTTGISINRDLLRHNPRAKIIRVSKSIMDACKLIDIDSIKENVNESNFDFKSLFILLDNDKSGVIKVERFGSDLSFLMMSNLQNAVDNKLMCTYNSYSFVAKSFQIEKNDKIDPAYEVGRKIISYENSVFVVQILTYLMFGEITEKYMPAKTKARKGLTVIFNNSKLNITFCDTLWKQRVCTEGFKVRGHFRLQPYGEKRGKVRLIWIEEFEKQGYNRKATVETQK